MSVDPHPLTPAAEILVVDDEVSNLRLLAEILSQAGYRVRAAAEPRLAIESALAFPPSLILLDVMMPEMDGFQVCRRLREHASTRDIPILFVSALNEQEHKVRGFEAGGVDYIPKPFQEQEVLARVKTHLQLRDMQVHLEALVAERTAELRATNEALEKEIQQRKRAQKTLGESEEKFRSLFESSPDLVALTDLEGTFLDINRTAPGYKKEAVIGTCVTDYLTPQQNNEFKAAVTKAIQTGESQSYEPIIPTPHGIDLYWHNRVSPLRTGDQVDRLVINFTDITERKQVEEELKQREAILEAVARAAERFLARSDWEDEMNAVLARLGTATGVDRGYVFENRAGLQGETLASQRFEWCAPDIPSQIDNPDLQDFPLRAWGFGRWEEVLGQGAILHGHVCAFPESEQQVLAVQGIQSLVIVPIYVQGQWWGFIGFDACQRDREWSLTEQDALKTAANILGAAIAHRRAKEELQSSEERYRALVEQAQDGIVVLQEGEIKYANKYVTELCGYTVQELLNTPFRAYLPADQLPDVKDRYRRRLNGEAVPSIYPSAIQHKDGSRVEVEFNAGLTTYNGQPADQVIVRDIRGRLQAQREREASQRLLSLVIDHVPAQIAYVDVGRRYSFVNRHYEQNYDIPRSQFVGRHVQEVLGQRGYVAAEPHIAAVLAGDAVSYEELFAYPDREPRWMAIDYVPDRDRAGEVQGFVTMTTDITADKQLEIELTKSKERLEEAQAIAQIGDWEYDILAGKTTWSDEMYRIFGVDRQHYAPTDRSDREFCHPEDRPALQEAFDRFFTSGEDLDTDYRIVTPQGEAKACRIRGRLVRDDEGTLRFAIGTTEDITARKQVEQQVQEYQRRLKALASQLTLTEERERRRIARELHDEVGQTLAFARMRLASAREASSEAKREIILDQVSQALRQAIGEIRDLVFDLSSPLMHELGLAFALKEWVEEQVGRKQGLQTEFIDDGRHLPLDDDVTAILFRSTRELLTNVVKHAAAKRVIVRLESEAEGVRIAVQDDGIGFDVHALPGAAARERGFGLFSIQERMADLGGSLEIVSAPGQGCTAILTAPVLTD